jgi:hypothetical protein
MKNKNLLCLVAMMGLMLGAQSAPAASMAVQEMAGIMDHLAHYPSAAEKVKLQAIEDSKDSTEQERILAAAISDIKHHAAPQDKEKLNQVINDASAPAEVRDLASIVLNISHHPTAADKEKLEMMMK